MNRVILTRFTIHRNRNEVSTQLIAIRDRRSCRQSTVSVMVRKMQEKWGRVPFLFLPSAAATGRTRPRSRYTPDMACLRAAARQWQVSKCELASESGGSVQRRHLLRRVLRWVLRGVRLGRLLALSLGLLLLTANGRAEVCLGARMRHDIHAVVIIRHGV
jgi:hypothetical protein